MSRLEPVIAHQDAIDPHQVLGIERNASAEEIKQAYRREAMKWHPDRNQNSTEARERFHQAAEAYKTLSERAANGNREQSNSEEPGKHQYDYSAESDSRHTDQDQQRDARDQFADSVFWDAMLDYAIKLAQTGSNESEIAEYLGKLGCPATLTRVIAEKAFNIHAHYAAPRGRRRRTPTSHSTISSVRRCRRSRFNRIAWS